MSRVPTDIRQFFQPLESYQPVASPTDQFVTPHAKLGGGGELISLARDLTQLEPRMQHIVDTTAAGMQQAGQQAAEADYANKRWKNIQDFKQAVQSGQIPAAVSPWYNIRTKQLFAQDRAYQAYQQAELAWQQNAAIKGPAGDNLNDARDFFKQQLGGVAQGADPWEAEVITPFLQHAENSLMQQHLQYRQQMRPVEHESAFKRNISDLLSSVDDATMKAYNAGDPAAIAKVTSVQQGLQHLLDTELNFTDAHTAKSWMKESLTATTMDRLNGDVFRKFYMGLTKSDGSPVDNSDETKAHARDLDRTVMERQYQQRALQYQSLHLDDELHLRAWRTHFAEMTEQALQADPNWNINKLTPDQMSKWITSAPPEIQGDAVNYLLQRTMADSQMVNLRNEEDVRDYVSRHATDISGMLKDPAGRQAFLEFMYGHNSEAKAHQITVTSLMLNKEWAPQSDPDTLLDLLRKRDEGTLTFNDVDEAKSKLDERTAMSLANDVNAQHHVRMDTFRPLIQTATQRLGMQIQAKAYDDMVASKQVPEEMVNLLMQRGIPRRDAVRAAVADSETFRAANTAAQNELSTELWKLTRQPDFVALSSDQKVDRINSLVDDIAEKHGGYTNDKFQDWEANRLKEADKSDQKPQTPAPTPPKVMPKPGTPQSSVVRSVLSQSFPPHMQSITMEQTEAAHSLLKNVPPGVSKEILDKYALPPDPSTQVAGFFRTLHKESNDPVAQAAQVRDDLRRAGGEIDMGAKWANEEFKRANGRMQINLLQAIAASNSKARRLEGSFTPGMVQEYQNLVSKAAGGMLPPGSYARLLQLEQMRSQIAQAREAGGWTADEVAKMVEAGQKDAWRDHPMYWDTHIFSNPDMLATIQNDMKKVGLDPKNQTDLNDFVSIQSQLVSYLRTHQ
jgi:hypothetical protein